MQLRAILCWRWLSSETQPGQRLMLQQPPQVGLGVPWRRAQFLAACLHLPPQFFEARLVVLDLPLELRDGLARAEGGLDRFESPGCEDSARQYWHTGDSPRHPISLQEKRRSKY